MSLYEPIGFSRKRAASVKAEGARRRAAMPPPGFRLLSEQTFEVAELALMRIVADWSTDLYQVPMGTRGGEHVQFVLLERDKNLAALREINPGLAETWAGHRYHLPYSVTE